MFLTDIFSWELTFYLLLIPVSRYLDQGLRSCQVDFHEEKEIINLLCELRRANIKIISLRAIALDIGRASYEIQESWLPISLFLVFDFESSLETSSANI